MPETGWKTDMFPTDSGPVTLTWPYRSFAFAPVGATYYLAPEGDDAGTGQIGAPWRTLSHAATVLSAGDALYFRAGTYTGRWDLANLVGTAEAPILLSAYPGETVSLVASEPGPGSDNGHIARLSVAPVLRLQNSCRYVWVHGLELIGSRSYYLAGGGATVECCLLVPDSCRVLNCTLHQALHCGLKGGIEASEGISYLWEGNVCYDNGLNSSLDHGIYVMGPYAVLRGNACFNNAGWGIQSFDSDDNNNNHHQAIYNNVCFDNGRQGILIAGPDNVIAHNVSSQQTASVLWYHEKCLRNTFLNNLFFANIDYQVAADSSNGLYEPAGNLLDYTVIDPSAWQWYSEILVWEQTGTHMIYDNPEVESEANHDYRLTANSPVQGRAGTVFLNGGPSNTPDPGLFPATLYTDPEAPETLPAALIVPGRLASLRRLEKPALVPMAPADPFDKWLFLRLSASSELLQLLGGAKLYAELAPQGTVCPYVLWSLASASDRTGPGAVRCFTRASLTIKCVTDETGFRLARRLSDLVDAALQGIEGELDTDGDGVVDWYISGMYREFPLHYTEVYQGKRTSYAGGQYRIIGYPLALDQPGGGGPLG